MGMKSMCVLLGTECTLPLKPLGAEGCSALEVQDLHVPL